VMVPAAQRGQAITFILLGWSLASVLGMPIGAWVGETWGWRWAIGAIGGLALLAAVGVWRTMPDGVRPAALSRAAWAQVFTHPGLMAIVGVTVFSAAGQFTLFTYFAPYYRQVLGASPGEISLLFLWFGAVGVLGNVLLSRHIDRIGADRAVFVLLLCMASALLLWPLGSTVLAMAAVLTPWALGCFASNAGQQARLVQAAPVLAPALVALNSSAMFAGQALGAASGGAAMTAAGWGPLHWMGLAWMLAAVALSAWATQRLARSRQAGAKLA
jgi:predicted MFS family arabinose efflux permease